VNRAGKILASFSIRDASTDDLRRLQWAHAVINDWRAAHNYPLNAVATTLQNRVRKIDPDAVRAQRLKRLPSIDTKLRRFPSMRLTQMQDVGGCRVVMRDVGSVAALLDAFDESDAKNPKRYQRIGFDDYIETPKTDGYRGVHLIYEYRSAAPQTKIFDGQRIEIQIRSRLQHAWATAVETVDIYTDQALKTGGGEPEWRRFFALVGSMFALREGTPIVPDMVEDAGRLLLEVDELQTRLKVLPTLHAWRAAVHHSITSATAEHAMYLLYLDARPDVRKLEITGFRADELQRASDEYLRLEQSIADEAMAQAVLVSVDSVANLAEMYPNYSADTELFIREMIAAATDIAGT
jgi:ppGpp synthetase/RelA/SpoT-type nucleotidyltranferase